MIFVSAENSPEKNGEIQEQPQSVRYEFSLVILMNFMAHFVWMIRYLNWSPIGISRLLNSKCLCTKPSLPPSPNLRTIMRIQSIAVESKGRNMKARNTVGFRARQHILMKKRIPKEADFSLFFCLQSQAVVGDEGVQGW